MKDEDLDAMFKLAKESFPGRSHVFLEGLRGYITKYHKIPSDTDAVSKYIMNKSYENINTVKLFSENKKTEGSVFYLIIDNKTGNLV